MNPLLYRESLFLIKGDSETELLQNLADLSQNLQQEPDIPLEKRACSLYFRDFARKSAFCCSLVASKLTVLEREIKAAEKGIPIAFATGKQHQSPAGSYFTARPLGPDAEVVYVYPGAGSAYIDLGKDIFRMFPDLHDFLNDIVPNPEAVLHPAKLYPRSQNPKKKPERFNTMEQMSVGVTFSAIFTEISRNILKIKPAAAMGYSMGEASGMWYGLRVWNAENIENVFYRSPVFSEGVAGEMKSLQKYWKLPAAEVQERWQSFSVISDSEILREKMAKHNAATDNPIEKIGLTFVNTPTGCIVSGDRESCQAFFDAYELKGQPVKLNNVTHHDFVRSEYDDLIKMHDMELQDFPADIRFYGGNPYRPLPADRQVIAESCTELCMRTVDFRAQVEKVYADGGRIFIEQGANAFCSRWISETLKDVPHLSVPFNRKGGSDMNNLNYLLARLISHNSPVDLSPIFGNPPAENTGKKKRQLFKTVRPGGKPVTDAVLTDALREKFRMPAPAAEKVLVSAEIAEPVVVNVTIEKPDYQINMSQNSEKPTGPGTVGENGLRLQDYTGAQHLAGKNVIWNEADLREFAYGKIGKVFGSEYDIIDTYSKRVMLPMDPYLLVSRVTDLQAKTGEFKPSKMTTEYDIPYNSWFATDGQIPWAVAVESGQCDLLLISYIGIDFEAKGERMYRLLDCTMTFMDDLPLEGQTLRYDIRINGYARNGGSLLFFFEYDCYVEDRKVLIMRGGCAGFFTEGELSKGQGVVYKKEEIAARRDAEKRFFAPLLDCPKTTFNREELLHMVAGDLDKVFGPAYESRGLNKSLRMPPEQILMLDRITKTEIRGGAYGLGFVEAEKDLKADDWYFPCHFRDDEVLAGSLQAEGGGQLLRFFMLYLGMQRLTEDARFQPVVDIPQKVRCRKEIPAKTGKLIYRMEVKEIGLLPHPYVVADLEIIYNDTVAVHFENLGLHLREKTDPMYLEKKAGTFNGVAVPPASAGAVMDESHITEFALGNLERAFRHEKFRVYEGKDLSRQPNTHLQVISRIKEVTGERFTNKAGSAILAEYDVPADAWYFQTPSAEMPYAILMEIALQPCGLLGAYMGTTLKYPDTELFFRNLDGAGEMTEMPDLRGKTITNRCVMTSQTAMAGTIILKFTYEVSLDGKPFYTGWSSFGFFPKAALTSQAGLDEGKLIMPWWEQNEIRNYKKFDLALPIARKFFYGEKPGTALRLGERKADFLHEVRIVENGGEHGKGYVWGRRTVKPSDWYFTCHFYQDPVQPGSLGVEAMLQAVKAFAIQQKLGEGFRNPRFEQADTHKVSWKYRGQILSDEPNMQLEVSIKNVERTPAGRIKITADGYLWKNKMRIYQLTDLALEIRES